METGNVIRKTSSWPIVGGSVEQAIICESSNSAADSDYHDDAIGFVVRRPSVDSAPCEITIGFVQQHEIKQVYVRSSAKVYEIYYTSDLKGENEYLCTVRCGVVSGNEKLLNENDVRESLLTTSSEFNRSWEEGISCSGSGSNTNEDGWVDVKVPDSAKHGHGEPALSKQNDIFAEKHNQVLFEATAEIEDAEPVLSVTLRLLSIQSGDYIYIDEIYVFADPHVSTDKGTENSSGNTMMSMLIPTLLQLSKCGVSQNQECNSSSGERGKQKKAENNYTGVANISQALPNKILNEASSDMSEPLLQVPYCRNNHCSTSRDVSSCHSERLLDELVSRVAKIEQFCLRFEEKLLKPISSMEARLVKMETQLESFVQNPQFSDITCTRISAPESSYNGSQTNSMCADGNKDDCLSQESMNKDDCPQELQTPCSDASFAACSGQSSGTSSTTVPQLHPSLIVTAPDFSNIDDEEENDADEAMKKLPNDNLKKPLSINDALASALASLLSSVSTDPKYDDKVEKAAHCPGVDGGRNAPWSAFTHSEKPVIPSGEMITGISCKDLALTEREFPALVDDIKDKEDCKSEQGGSLKLVDSSAGSVIKIDQQAAEVGSRELVDLEHDLGTPALVSSTSKNDSLATLEVPDCRIDSTEVPGVLHDILKVPSPVVVDFGISLLDVEFASLEDSSAKSPLEALLIDTPGAQDEVLFVKENSESSYNGHNELVIIENEELVTSELNSEICFPPCEFGYMSSNTEHELQDQNERSNDTQETLI